MDRREELPPAAGAVAAENPELWEAFAALGKAAAGAGPLSGSTLRLVKLALAVGSAQEGATHSHVRRGLAEGLTAAELEHVALLAIPMLGFARGVQALTWIRDLTQRP